MRAVAVERAPGAAITADAVASGAGQPRAAQAGAAWPGGHARRGPARAVASGAGRVESRTPRRPDRRGDRADPAAGGPGRGAGKKNAGPPTVEGTAAPTWSTDEHLKRLGLYACRGGDGASTSALPRGQWQAPQRE